jgi:hypothetical protein
VSGRRRGAGADYGAVSGGVTVRQLSRLLRGDLDTIILAALRKEPAGASRMDLWSEGLNPPTRAPHGLIRWANVDVAVSTPPELLMFPSGEHAGNLLKECEGPKRLSQHRTRDPPTLANSRDKQHRRWRLEGGKVGGEIQTIHLGQQDIRHDKCELPSQAAREGKGLLPVFSCEDSVALIGQRLRQDAAEYGVVLDNQHHILTQLL